MTSPARRDQLATAIYALGATVVRLVPRDVSLTAISTLSTLERTGPRRVTDLAVVQGVSQPSMTSLVGTLERSGYVARRSDPSDGRASLVALTGAGAAALAERRRAGTESVGGLLDKLTPDEVAALVGVLPVLERLRDVDDQQREGT